MRVGLFGGRFDPVHWGHVRPVRRALEGLDLDRVLYLPTAQPPHRGSSVAPPLARYAMLELALLDDRDLVVSTHELTLGETAYTVDTVAHFRRAIPSATLVLLLGGDALAELPSYHRYEELVAEIELGVLARPGWELAEALPAALAAARREGRLHLLRDEVLDLSASELRRRLAAGESVSNEMMPPRVLDYVRKYGLYR